MVAMCGFECQSMRVGQKVSFRANAENLENSTVFIEFCTSETISNPIQRHERLVDRFKLLKTVWVLLWRKRGKQNIATPEGHSTGGIYIRDHATRYPQEVRGLIFVDASTPLQGQTTPFKKVKQSPRWPTILLTRLAYITNVPRLAGSCSLSGPGSESPPWMLLAEGLCHPQFRASRDESDSFDLSGEETIQTGSYGALPILIFSHDPAKTKQVTNWENSWTQMQENLKKLSTRSRRVVARNSTHYVQLDRAQLVVKEVSLLIEQIRGTTPQTACYGSTITE
jgi:pimeloyl-ACP methyl ester carboxylesterase